MLKLPMEDESQYFISPTPVNPRTPSASKVKKRKKRSSLSLKSQKKSQNLMHNSSEVKDMCAEIPPSVSEKNSSSSDLRDKVVNSTPQMLPKRVKLFNVDSTPVYNKPPTFKSSQEKLGAKKSPLKSSQNTNAFTNNKSSLKYTGKQEKLDDETSLNVDSSEKTKISEEENLIVKEKVDLPFIQTNVTPASVSLQLLSLLTLFNFIFVLLSY